MKKFIFVVAFLMVVGFFSTPAKAGWGTWVSCEPNCPTISEVREEAGLGPDGFAKTTVSSAKHKAEVAAHNESLVKKHKESGNKDIDELNPGIAKFLGTDGPTYKERMAELCFEATWYGQKEVDCK